MKYLIILVALLTVACADNTTPRCNTETPASLETVNVGDNFSDLDSGVQALFTEDKKTQIDLGSVCVNSYQFDQVDEMNEDSFQWCYYITIEFDCDTNEIVSTYKD